MERYLMKRTIFLQDEDAVWLKGNIHSHSVFSDGSLTPEQMKDAYVHHGYDFLAVTDHDIYTDTRKLTDDRFTMIQGFELWANATNDHDIHVHFLWADQIEGISDKQVLRLPQRTGKVSMAFCYNMKEKGAYIMLNHPHWSMLNSSEVEDENPFDAVEVINHGTQWLENTGDGSVFWSEMLYRGCKLWGGGGDDNHNHSDLDSMYSDSFGGFTVVKASDRSPQAIMKAMKEGSFYTSTGPSIYDFFVEDDQVHVVCSPCEKIFISGHGRPYQRKLGRHVTEFVTRLKGTERLVRAECMDARGRSAYTNPIYLQ
jgi:hypothetical protein